MNKGNIVIDQDREVMIVNAVFHGKKEVFRFQDRLCDLTFGHRIREPNGSSEWALVDRTLKAFAVARAPCQFGNSHRGEIVGIKRRGTEVFAQVRAESGQTVTRPLTDIDLAPPPTAL
jgi:hypothetical protein